GLYCLARFARFIRLFTRVRPRDRAAPGSLWLWECLLWCAWVVALVGGGVLLHWQRPASFLRPSVLGGLGLRAHRVERLGAHERGRQLAHVRWAVTRSPSGHRIHQQPQI